MKDTLAIVAIAVCLFVGLFGVPSHDPQPVGVSACFEDYQHRMSAAWTEGAGMSFETDHAAFDWIKSRADTERKSAFAPVHQREQDVLGEKYDDAKRKALWLQFAEESK